ncbi:MAG: S-layer homology domain-containing protein [Phascolarctobacterium sp.]|uniref:S-layer homology domain-containing protein n=1 Tax=Phascolarctobacterium sp. TaxID=2049039 RepID=UPI0026DC8605|nr:S-layer homology domain-containing protein [Phascolarctobacterium sp.]MDO4922371.1 S-layer homology domain-containing protein [Phascolarctobacterium sp.]
MKKSLVLAMAMALGVTASAYAANPFSDVPAGHWAYDSVNKLAAAGVIDGYGDATFGGDKLMTRYEMAQIVAKAMAKGANVDKLAAEFADELDTLGVRVANLEKKADNVKITGEIRAHYENYDDTKDADNSYLRTRIWINGQVNEDWSYTGMIENRQHFVKKGNSDNSGDEETRFQRAFVNGRIGGVKVEAGRNNQSILGGEILSNRTDAVKLSYGKDVKVTVQGGKLATASGAWISDPDSVADDYYAVTVAGKIGKLGLEADYVDEKDDIQLGGIQKVATKSEDNYIWAVAANYKFDEDWAINAAYLQGDVENAKGEDDGYFAGVKYKGAKASKAGSWGLFATYYDMAASTYVANGWGSSFANNMRKNEGGFEGWKVGANWAIAKNIVAQVEYMTLDGKNSSKHDDDSVWSQVVFTF